MTCCNAIKVRKSNLQLKCSMKWVMNFINVGRHARKIGSLECGKIGCKKEFTIGETIHTHDLQLGKQYKKL